jgi:hypothetical protein
VDVEEVVERKVDVVERKLSKRKPALVFAMRPDM